MAASVKSMALKKRKLEDMSMDEFMTGGFESSGSESSSGKLAKKAKNKQSKAAGKANSKGSQKTGVKGQQSKSKQETKGKGVMSKHKATLDQLQQQDPEFYMFLKDEDKSLLQFGDLSGSDVTDSSDEEDDTSKSDDVELNKDSDESDEDIDLPETSSEEETEPAEQKKTKSKKDLKNKQKIDSKAKADGKTKDEKKKKEKKGKDQTEGKGKKTVKKKEADDESDGEGSSEEEDGDEMDWDFQGSDEDSEEDQLHIPAGELEEMSDSDEEELDEEDGEKKKQKSAPGTLVTVKMVKGWEERFKTSPSAALLHEVTQAFRAAVQQTTTKTDSTKYVVQGGKVFNAVVRLCLVEMSPALQKVLSLPETKDLQKPVLPSNQNKYWKKIKTDVKFYLTDALQLLTSLSEENMVNIVLKHIHKMVAFYACFPKLTKSLMKKLITIWSEGQEASRVLAFLCINKITCARQEDMLENCIKHMYMAYVKNCKFTSANVLPLINFMQRSYVEILSRDFGLAYQYAFMYIRQLAIHLRSAISTKKKESCQAVYNWQYVHCLGLWSRVLSMTHPNEVLEPLIYPLVQTTIGTIKLIPTAKYYPLRFHCVKNLTMLSKSTGTFIPVLPFLLEVFELTDFNKKPKAISLKPLNFACILKLSKPQLTERSFKEGVVDQLYELLLEYFHANAHTIGFPELALPALIQLKGFLKACKVSLFTKQIKQIVDKVRENSEFVTARRRSSTISLTDKPEIARWERECEDAGTPLGKFYKTWRKLRDRELMHQIASRDQIVGKGKGLPDIERPKGASFKATDEDKQEFSALFEGDSDNDEDMTARFLPPSEKRKLKKEAERKDKKMKKGQASEEDYSDLDSDDLAQLAGSASDDSDAEMDDGKAAEDGDDDVEGEDDSSDDGNESDDEAEDDDDDDAEDIVKEFTMSSDED